MKLEVAKERAAASRLAQIIVQRMANVLTDEEALTGPEAFETWAAGRLYSEGQIVRHEGGLYRIMQVVNTSQVHQPPGSEGVLAIYRPITIAQAGTLEDPITYTHGMDCVAGKYYSYEGQVWLCKGDMLPCVWPPSAGIWQWELITA